MEGGRGAVVQVELGLQYVGMWGGCEFAIFFHNLLFFYPGERVGNCTQLVFFSF